MKDELNAIAERPSKPVPGLAMMALWLIGLVSLSGVSGALAVVIDRLFYPATGDGHTSVWMWPIAYSLIVAMGVPYTIALAKRNDLPWSDLWGGGVRLGMYVLASAAGLGTFFIFAVLFGQFDNNFPPPLAIVAPSTPALLLKLATGGFGVGLVEELFFRGLLLAILMRKYASHLTAIAVSSAAFVLYHVEYFGDPLYLLWFFVFSVGVGFARVSTGSLVPPILIHAVNNVSAFLFEATTT